MGDKARQSGFCGLCSPGGKKCCVTSWPSVDLELILVPNFLVQPCPPPPLYKALRLFLPGSQVGSPPAV